jgi:hypothetical protein
MSFYYGNNKITEVDNSPVLSVELVDISASSTGTFNYNSATNSTAASFIAANDGVITYDKSTNSFTIDFTKLTTRSQIYSTYQVIGTNSGFIGSENHSAGDGDDGGVVDLEPWEVFQVEQTYNSTAALSTLYKTGADASWDDSTKTMMVSPSVGLGRLTSIIICFGQMSGNPYTYECNIFSSKVLGDTGISPSVNFMAENFPLKSDLPDNTSHGLSPYTGNTAYSFDTIAALNDFLDNELSFHIYNGNSTMNVSLTYTGADEAADTSVYLREIHNITLNLIFRGAGASHIALYIINCTGSTATNGAVTLKSYNSSTIYTIKSIMAFNTSLYISNLSTSSSVSLYNCSVNFGNTSGSAVATFGTLSLNLGSYVTLRYNCSFSSLSNTNTGGTLNIDDNWTGSFTTAPAAVHSVVIRDQRTNNPLETYARKAAQ